MSTTGGGCTISLSSAGIGVNETGGDMKVLNFLNCRKVTIEHEKGTEVYETSGSARVETFENGVLEIRTFTAVAKAQPKKPAGQTTAQ